MENSCKQRQSSKIKSIHMKIKSSIVKRYYFSFQRYCLCPTASHLQPSAISPSGQYSVYRKDVFLIYFCTWNIMSAHLRLRHLKVWKQMTEEKFARL